MSYMTVVLTIDINSKVCELQLIVLFFSVTEKCLSGSEGTNKRLK
jgi:hypothetical protein